MTCIVGIETDCGVLIGGDSAGVSGWSLTTRADEKVFTRSGYAFGFTTSFRMGQLLRYTGTLPTASGVSDSKLDSFLVAKFIPAVRDLLRDGGWLEVDKSRESGGAFLLGVRGRLYEVESDFQVGRSVDGYAAVGCGYDLALGALHATRGLDLSPELRARWALEAAAHHSAGVTAPFAFVEAS